MADQQRFAHNNNINNNHQRNTNMHQFEGAQPNRADLFLRSESPRVQQILLHQKLKEEIERNSTGRVRYVDSELYLRNKNNNLERSPSSGASEIQIATLNIGLNKQSSNNNNFDKQSSSTAAKGSAGASSSSATNKRPSYDLKSELDLSKDQQTFARDNGNNNSNKINKNCQVCQIKEVRQDLMNINKIVQERNEQITKLKAKCLRSYFERQMI